ncbi:MAG: hypothetical protein H6735_14010 [Alphaproteobacteria bacterium]|nr:hypothetical protein [Alphaproteobacteria bacterium]
MVWWMAVSLAAQPRWEVCRPRADIVSTETIGGIEPADLPRLPRSGGRPATVLPTNAARLVVTEDRWLLDGEQVDRLPRLDEVLLFVDADLSAASVVTLFEALRASGPSHILVARQTDRQWPITPTVHRRLAGCPAGRALLQPGSCEEVDALWARVARSPRCHLSWALDDPSLHTVAVPVRGTQLALDSLELDPEHPTWWSGDERFEDLLVDEGWIELGQRPVHRPVASEQVRLRHRTTASLSGPARDPTVPCRFRVFIEPDGTASRVEPVGCEAAAFVAVRDQVRSWRWYPPEVGSESPTRVVTEYVLFPYADVPAVRVSDTTQGTVLARWAAQDPPW